MVHMEIGQIMWDLAPLYPSPPDDLDGSCDENMDYLHQEEYQKIKLIWVCRSGV